MKPGATISPLASIVRAAEIREARASPMNSIRSPLIPISAVIGSEPLPSITVPPWINRSTEGPWPISHAEQINATMMPSRIFFITPPLPCTTCLWMLSFTGIQVNNGGLYETDAVTYVDRRSHHRNFLYRAGRNRCRDDPQNPF